MLNISSQEKTNSWKMLRNGGLSGPRKRRTTMSVQLPVSLRKVLLRSVRLNDHAHLGLHSIMNTNTEKYSVAFMKQTSMQGSTLIILVPFNVLTATFMGPLEEKVEDLLRASF